MKKYQEFEDVQEEKNNKKTKSNSPFSLKDVLEGSFLAGEKFQRQYVLLFILTILALIYIGNSYSSEQTIKDIYNMQNEIKELHYEVNTIASTLMIKTKRTEVIKQIQQRGINLEISNDPIKRVKIEQ